MTALIYILGAAWLALHAAALLWLFGVIGNGTDRGEE